MLYFRSALFPSFSLLDLSPILVNPPNLFDIENSVVYIGLFPRHVFVYLPIQTDVRERDSTSSLGTALKG
jgi:hypothetical protein